LIFGLSNAQAAATLATVLVGYNIVLNKNEIAEAALLGQTIAPVRLLNESILNGTILMILVTCTIASLVVQMGAKNVALLENSQQDDDSCVEPEERILIPVNNQDTAPELINLSMIIMAKRNKAGLFALNVIDNDRNTGAKKKSKKIARFSSQNSFGIRS
jgi:hypothetical protein